MLFDCILLINLKQMKTERSAAAVFHILKGKTSIQTVQDIHIFELEKFYGIGSFLNKRQFDERIAGLIRDGKISKHGKNDKYAVTEKGIAWLSENKSHVPLHYFDGYRYKQTATGFYERLLLLVQTLTNSKMHYFSFMPVVGNRSTENWVKAFYRKTRDKTTEILTLLYQELSQLLSDFTEREAEIFVDRLSGYNHYGLSIHQLATAYGIKNEDVSLMLTGTVHHIVATVQKQTEKFPLMSYIMADLMNPSKLSNSAKITRHLLNKNFSISQIAEKRQLKHNTIHDHIVELAYNDAQFSFANFIPKEKQDAVIKAIQHVNSYKLKQIKDQLGNEFSYFEIRLVLAASRNLLK